MAGEKVEVEARPMTENDVPFNDFMEGDAWSPGGQHDLNSRGMHSGADEGNRYSPGDVSWPDKPEENTYMQQERAPEPQTAETEADWKQRYGAEANEKGEWRRAANEALQELNTLKQELAAMRNGYNQPQYQHQPQYQSPPQHQQPQQPQLPGTFFPNREQNEIVEVADVDRLLRETVAPAMMQLYAQQQQMQQQQFQVYKQAKGITMQAEQQLLTTYPWLNNLPDGPARIDAMSQLMVQQTRQQEQPQRPSAAQASQAARRVTYVESAGAKSGTDQHKSLDDQFKEEFYGAKTAFDKKKVLEKYGIGAVNDWGPQYYTR